MSVSADEETDDRKLSSSLAHHVKHGDFLGGVASCGEALASNPIGDNGEGTPPRSWGAVTSTIPT
jgi:hypothetical protein